METGKFLPWKGGQALAQPVQGVPIPGGIEQPCGDMETVASLISSTHTFVL